MIDIKKDFLKNVYLGLQRIVIGEYLEPKTPVRTGDVAGSWKVKLGKTEGDFVIYNKHGNIVEYLEEGTKAHIIKPNTKKMLRFPLKDKNNKPKKPTFKNPVDEELFKKNGKIFYYNKAGIPVLGFSKEGSLYYMFAKKVKHPGFEGKHFIRESMRNNEMWNEFKQFVKNKTK
jgi:hypothetical protein